MSKPLIFIYMEGGLLDHIESDQPEKIHVATADRDDESLEPIIVHKRKEVDRTSRKELKEKIRTLKQEEKEAEAERQRLDDENQIGW